jgi:1-acyl-sn-glycerol-3-phosphate acyltransferase
MTSATPFGALDGFDLDDVRPFRAFDPVTAARFYARIERLSRRMHISVDGTQNLPSGRALLVGNHTFGWDVAFPIARIWHETGRSVWVLGDHVWWKLPFLRRLAAAVGTVDGTSEHADALLSRDELVLVLPGGLREAVKPRDLRYRLLWGHRYGFVKAAIRNRAPIVPFACIGADDLFDFVGNAYRRGERWLRRPGIPVPLPRRILPIPHRARLAYAIGEPIAPPAPGSENDPAVVRRYRREVAGAVYELLDRELALRVGIDLS